MAEPDVPERAPGTPRLYRGAALGLPAAGPGSLGGIGQRFVGLVIDALVLTPITILASMAGADRLGGSTQAPGPAVNSTLVFVASVLVVVADAVYTIGLIGWRGKTAGQALMGLRVVRITDGGLPGYEVAARRWAVIGVLTAISTLAAVFDAPAQSVLAVGLGLLQLLVLAWAIWDPNRQGLHDRFAGTIVIREPLHRPVAPAHPSFGPDDTVDDG